MARILPKLVRPVPQPEREEMLSREPNKNRFFMATAQGVYEVELEIVEGEDQP